MTADNAAKANHRQELMERDVPVLGSIRLAQSLNSSAASKFTPARRRRVRPNRTELPVNRKRRDRPESAWGILTQEGEKTKKSRAGPAACPWLAFDLGLTWV
jgi:hypothetical protein